MAFILLSLMLPFTETVVSAKSDNMTGIGSVLTDNVTLEVPLATGNITEVSTPVEQEKENKEKEEKTEKPGNDRKVDKHYFLVEPDKENKLELPSKKATLSIPKGAIEETIIVEIGDIPAPGSTGTRILNLFEFNAWEADTDILESFSENGTSVIDTLTDNTTLEEPETADNTTSELPEVTDNITIEAPDTTDNVTLDEPETSDNVSSELPETTGNVTIESPDTTDNITLEEPEISDNTTAELPDVTVNVTIEMSDITDNVTLERPETADNTTSENEGFSENITKEKKLNDKLNKEQLKSAIKIENKVSEFNESLTIEIQHSPGDLKGLDPGSLKLYYLNEERFQWQKVSDSYYDKNTRILTATIDHFSTYGEQANPLEVGPGRVMASDVNLHSGTATYSYPIELPPGPGGFKPELNLVYNSGSVDEMKNKQDVGSWVGIGWSLHFGKITTDNSTDKVYLDLNGASYELVAENTTHYHTTPEEYFKIVKASDNSSWQVWDKEGVYYLFGGAAGNSTQYRSNGENYRWDLSQIMDTNGNTADFTYTQSIITKDSETWVRSAYPYEVVYGKTKIQFNEGYDEGSIEDEDGCVRYDNPISTEDNDAPEIMEDRRLDGIEVTFNNTLVRKYEFSYDTTDRYLTDVLDEDFYFAGAHTLKSITQKGTDNNSLPSISFYYQNLQIYRKASGQEYPGNPGNPASLYWPFLTTIHSGYGGIINFSYTQIPDSEEEDIWTRQAVTSKLINSQLGKCSYRIPLTIDSSKIDNNLPHFPVPIHLCLENFQNSNNIPDIFEIIGDNYQKIKATEDDGETQLYVEVENWDVANREGLLWVSSENWTISSSTDTVIYLYYGTDLPVNTQYVGTIGSPAGQSVWDSNFEAVYHMTDDSENATLILDSTVNGNNGSKYPDYETEQVDGTIGNAQDFDGAYSILLSDTFDFDSPFTFEAVAKMETHEDALVLFSQSDTTDVPWVEKGFGLTTIFSPNKLYAVGRDTSYHLSEIGELDGFPWRYFNVTRPSGNNLYSYRNNAPTSSTSVSGSINSDYDPTIGGTRARNYANWNDCIDELRISCSDRSDAWQKATNLAIWDEFLTYSEIGILSNNESSQELYTYQYTGEPIYKGTDWDQEFKGWNEVTVTDSGNNSVKHWFYTTGYIEGNQTEILTGKEYKTEWYDEDDNLLKSNSYTWDFGILTYATPDNPQDWDNYVKIKIDSNKIDEELMHFPLLVRISDNTSPENKDLSLIFDEIGDNYQKIKVTEFDGETQLFVEVENWDVENREGLLWVSSENWTISNTEDTDIYLCYGSDLPENTQYVGKIGSVAGQAVWDDKFEAVYHMKDDTDNSSLILDSTSNGNNGNKYSGYETEEVDGVIGKSQDFNGAYSILLSDPFYFNSPFTFEAVAKMETHEDAAVLFSQSNTTEPPWCGNGFGLATIYVPNNLYTIPYDTAYHLVETGETNGFPWRYFTVNRNISNSISVYRNNENVGNESSIGSITSANIPTIGGTRARSVYNWNDCIDEIRISNIERSSAWRKATYYSCWDELNYYENIPYNIYLNLDQVEETTYDTSTTANRTTRTRYEYDDYGNVITEYRDGDIEDNTDNVTIQRLYSYNLDDNILSLPADERIYSGSGNATENLTGKTVYYYDYASSSETQPDKGMLTRIDTYNGSGGSDFISTNSTYDEVYGNLLAQQDASGNITRWGYDADGIYPEKKTLPNEFEESYDYEPGTDYVANVTDINGQVTQYFYDEFMRLEKVIRPGDDSINATTVYKYNAWGTLGQQNIEIMTKVGQDDYLWQKDYFDGLGRVIQTQSSAESGNISISGTVEYNNRGLVEKQYVPQLVDNTTVNGYYEPESGWRYSTCEYDALGRVISQTAADNTTVHRDYSVPWEEKLINESGNMTRYKYDAFGQLTEVEEYVSGNVSYAITQYSYDTLGNLVQVKDADNNTTNMTYNWLSQKLTMEDPDMGNWSYTYNINGNLETQTDAIGNTVSFTYDNLNRLTEKSYSVTGNTSPSQEVVYGYDTTNNSAGLRSCMMDELGSVVYSYDERGRLVYENRLVSGNSSGIKYTTLYTYDSADRLVSVTYPTGETVYQTYNDRGLPLKLFTDAEGTLADNMTYNQLGQVTRIDLGNDISTSYEYWGLDHATTSYGKLYSISVAGGSSLLDTEYTWDVRGNLLSRHTVHPSVDETEYFTYDSLDRLDTAILSGVYDLDYDYTTIGNIEKLNNEDYYYNGSQPHAVTSFNGTTYQYDDNGNMKNRGDQTIEWDAENRPVRISKESYAGNEAVDRMYTQPYGKTYIIQDNPVEYDGIIESIEIWAVSNMTGLRIGSYYLDSSDTYVCRDSELVGEVECGSKQTANVSINVQAGDLLGCYFVSGVIEVDWNSGLYDGLYFALGEYIDPGDNFTVYEYPGFGMSLKGIYSNTTTFTYDGDGNRVRKTVDGGDDILYINRYYEENLETGNITTSYYLGDRLVAQKEGTELRYIHQDHLSGTSLMTDDEAEIIGSVMKYYPYGDRLESEVNLPTDRLFTGQRYDDTGLYYYGARYYDPEIGRFISPDTFVQQENDTEKISNELTVNQIPVGLGEVKPSFCTYPDIVQQAPLNPQTLNRYSYVINNPLKYTDPYGWWTFGFGFNINCGLFGGISISAMLVWDDDGGFGVAGSASTGLEAGATLSATVQAQYTTADTILDLQGNSMTTGGSVGIGLIGGVEQVNAVGNNIPGQLDYIGWNLNGGIGIGTPVEVHSYYDITGVEIFSEPSKQRSDSFLPIDNATRWFDDSTINRQSGTIYTSTMVDNLFYLSLFF